MMRAAAAAAVLTASAHGQHESYTPYSISQSSLLLHILPLIVFFLERALQMVSRVKHGNVQCN